MWKLLALLFLMVHLGEAQRSFYAGRPGSHTKVLYQFRRNTTESTTTGDLSNRDGEITDAGTSTPLPSELQGTLEESDFVHRVSKWPEHRQPFWFKNRFAISSMRDRNVDASQRPKTDFQSPFIGQSRVGSRTSLNFAQSDRNNNNNEIFIPRNDDLVQYLRKIQRY